MIFRKDTTGNEFKQLTYPHMKLMYNMALRYCGNAFDAEDIVQETYMMAFSKFHQLREKSKCKSWLLTILKNNFLKTYHKGKSLQKLQEEDYIEHLKNAMASESAEDTLAKLSGQQDVQKAIDQLPPKYKEVLMLYHGDEMLYKDIADTLNIPIGTVMSRLTRARDALKISLLKQVKSHNNILNINFKNNPILKTR